MQVPARRRWHSVDTRRTVSGDIGFIGIEDDRRILFLVMAVALTTVAGGLGGIPMAGEYFTAILTNLSTVINAGAIAVILMIVYERVTAS